MKKLLLGAMMATFIVTGNCSAAYDKDNVLEESVYNEQLKYFENIEQKGKILYGFVKSAGDKTTEKAEGSDEVRQIEYASKELKDAVKDLLGTDKSDIDKEKYTKRENEVIKHTEQIILCINAIEMTKLQNDGDYSTAFEEFRQGIIAAFKGSAGISNDKIKLSIYSNLGKIVLVTEKKMGLVDIVERAKKAASQTQKIADQWPNVLDIVNAAKSAQDWANKAEKATLAQDAKEAAEKAEQQLDVAKNAEKEARKAKEAEDARLKAEQEAKKAEEARKKAEEDAKKAEEEARKKAGKSTRDDTRRKVLSGFKR